MDRLPPSAGSGPVNSVHLIDINERDIFGTTALDRAVINNEENSVESLINAGANVNLLNESSGRSPLQAAVENENIVELLLNAGANVTLLSDYPECSPLQAAVVNEN